MEDLIKSTPILSDSTTKPRPNFDTFMVTDSNARGHQMQQIEEKRRLRHMKFPNLKGRHDVDSEQENVDTNIGFKKWNDDGEYHANAPYRTFDNCVDPTSGFVSVGGDVDRKTGHSQIRSLVQLNKTPQAVTPRGQHSIRKEPSAPPELKREATWSPGAPTQWNSRKMLDITMRSNLGGWTSDTDPREASRPHGSSATSPDGASRSSRDKLALKYMYGTSTQRGYEEVPWDHFTPPKQWPPTSTAEEKPDQISHRWSSANKRYAPHAEEWQAVGRGLDWFLSRKNYYKDEAVAFCSQSKRTDHIPLYSGCIGADNTDDKDNAREPFNPYTVKRTEIPRPSETGHRPNIPLYAGCTLWQGYYAPAHSKAADRQYLQPTTNTVHKELPVEVSSPADHKRNAQMSKMITLVPPCNPFNSMEQERVVV